MPSRRKRDTADKKKKQEPVFTCEIPLRVNRKQRKVLDARFEAARQMYNALLGEALRRLHLLQQSKAYQAARRIPRDRSGERSKAFSAARKAYGFTADDLSRYATVLRHSWLEQHIDVHTAQKLSDRAFDAVNKVAFHKAKRVRFKGRRGIHSLESKSNLSGIRFKDGCLQWRAPKSPKHDLQLPMVPGTDRDPLIAYGLNCPIRYVRLVRRSFNGKDRYYAQLVVHGIPYHKPQHAYGSEVVGADLGPSTLAWVSDTHASLEPFCSALKHDERKIRRLERKLDRQRRANNPDCYDEQGRAIQGKHPIQKSRHEQVTLRHLQDIRRKEAAYRRALHGQMANRILAVGIDIRIEKVSYKAWQKQFGRSVSLRAPGKFVSILRYKAESAGGKVDEFGTRTTKLSQTCPKCLDQKKKKLSQRVHRCSKCGVVMQRDLASAFLARHTKNGLLLGAEAKASWPGAEPLLRAAWQQATQPAKGHLRVSAFGSFPKEEYRSQSESSGKHR